MQKTLETYCEVKFLENLFTQAPDTPIANSFLNQYDESEKWRKIVKIIFKNSLLKVDAYERIFEEFKHNPIFQKLISENNTGGSKLSKYKYDQTSPKPYSLHYCYEIPKGLDDLFTNSIKSWKDNINVISDRIKFKVENSPNQNTFPGWEFLRDVKLPITSVIINDRYLLYKNELLSNNLFYILENLLNNVNNSVDLSIITNEENVENVKRTYEVISTFISDRLSEKKINLNLVLLERNHPKSHDRVIITNYFRLVSQNSFNYYNSFGQLTASTELELIPLNAEDTPIFKLKLADLKELHKIGRCLGNGINDLLKYI